MIYSSRITAEYSINNEKKAKHINSIFNELDMDWFNNIDHAKNFIWLIKNNPDSILDYFYNIAYQVHKKNSSRTIKTFAKWFFLTESKKNTNENTKFYIIRPKKIVNWPTIISKVNEFSEDLIFEFYLAFIKLYSNDAINSQQIVDHYNKNVKSKIGIHRTTPLSFNTEYEDKITMDEIYQTYNFHVNEFEKYVRYRCDNENLSKVEKSDVMNDLENFMEFVKKDDSADQQQQNMSHMEQDNLIDQSKKVGRVRGLILRKLQKQDELQRQQDELQRQQQNDLQGQKRDELQRQQQNDLQGQKRDELQRQQQNVIGGIELFMGFIKKDDSTDLQQQYENVIAQRQYTIIDIPDTEMNIKIIEKDKMPSPTENSLKIELNAINNILSENDNIIINTRQLSSEQKEELNKSDSIVVNMTVSNTTKRCRHDAYVESDDEDYLDKKVRI